MSLPLLSSEHPTTQPSHHFILLTYITVITALADLLCADLEILSLVLPPTHFWFFSDNRTLVSFPDLPPSFSFFLTPSGRVRKWFPNLLSPSNKDYNSSAVGLVRYYAYGQNILWIRLAEGKSLNLQKFTLKSGWFRFPKLFCASTSSKSTSPVQTIRSAWNTEWGCLPVHIRSQQRTFPSLKNMLLFSGSVIQIAWRQTDRYCQQLPHCYKA